MAIVPESGRSSPAIDRSVVVLPQPDGPSSVNMAPSGTSMLTSSTASTRGGASVDGRRRPARLSPG
jgi:hypothetical protein